MGDDRPAGEGAALRYWPGEDGIVGYDRPAGEGSPKVSTGPARTAEWEMTGRRAKAVLR